MEKIAEYSILCGSISSHHAVPCLNYQPRERQEELWIRSDELNLRAETPFWTKFQGLLDSIDFDRQVREACAPFYTMNGPGQPGVDPVVYFKMLLIAFFENLPSERAIEARCADSLGIGTPTQLAATAI